MATLHLTTGLFPVPNLPAAAAPALYILLSSQQDGDAVVAWAVNHMQEGGGKARIRDGAVRVPGQGMTQVTLRPDEVEGRVIEVNLRLPGAAVVPSAAVVVSFLADESQQVAMWLAPKDFVDRARSGVEGPGRGRRRPRRPR